MKKIQMLNRFCEIAKECIPTLDEEDRNYITNYIKEEYNALKIRCENEYKSKKHRRKKNNVE